MEGTSSVAVYANSFSKFLEVRSALKVPLMKLGTDCLKKRLVREGASQMGRPADYSMVLVCS